LCEIESNGTSYQFNDKSLAFYEQNFYFIIVNIQIRIWNKSAI